MKYELQVLDHVISVDLKPIHFNRQKNKAAFIKKCSSFIAIEVERVNKVMVQDVLNCGNEKQITCYIQQHQHGIIKLLDMLQSYCRKEAPGNILNYPALKSFIDPYKKLLPVLDPALLFLRNNFDHYFDQTFKIPDYKRLALIPQIKHVLTQTRTELENNRITKGLIEIMVMPFKCFLNAEMLINERSLDYVRVYEKEVKAFLGKKEINHFSICELLIQLNLNDPAFAFYYIEKLKGADSSQSVTVRAEFYYLQLKVINQVSKKPGIAFDSSLPSIHDQLSTWLAEEIYFLEKKQQLECSFPGTSKDPGGKFEKVQTILSVPQLSLAVKLLMDSGIIKTKHTRHVMRMVSQSFRTGNIEQISEDSLRNKVYNIEPAAVEGMKKVIMGLWDKVREY